MRPGNTSGMLHAAVGSLHDHNLFDRVEARLFKRTILIDTDAEVVEINGFVRLVSRPGSVLCQSEYDIPSAK